MPGISKLERVLGYVAVVGIPLVAGALYYCFGPEYSHKGEQLANSVGAAGIAAALLIPFASRYYNARLRNRKLNNQAKTSNQNQQPPA